MSETHFMRPALSSRTLRLVLAVIGLLAAAGPAAAQKPKVKITAVRVGLPPGGRSTDRDDTGAAAHVAKFAAWAPVYVDLEMLDEVKEPAELVVETPDADEITTTLTVPLNLADARPGQALSARDMGLLPYLRPALTTGETTVTVRTTKGTALSEPFRLRSLHPKDPLTYVVLSLGSKLPGFDLPKPVNAGDNTPATGGALRGGRVETAAVTDVGMLPDQWFGYDAADLVILTTGSGSDDFLDRLFGEKGSASDKVKRAALLEWVRRGGRLVVSVGSNAAVASRMPALQELLPYSIKTDAPTRTPPRLDIYWMSSANAQATATMTAKGGPLSVANLTPRPDRPARVVIPPSVRQTAESEPVAVQSSYGLGRVTVIGFDLDRSPFTDLGNRADFWDWVLREGGAPRASAGPENAAQAGYGSAGAEAEDQLAAALRTHIDTFDGVPVISFGWVAVFIVLYILLIGPIEYIFLKKVLGRLELTWVTFPVIVLTVSAAAYFTAYAIKGRDLKVNKVDLIEVVAEFDPQTGKPGGRVYGTTWFTVFSPRIDTYTVGVNPNRGWTDFDASDSSLVGWVGGPRGGRASLIRRRYSYHVEPQAGLVGNGLVDVPIQVWSTKSFTAAWAGPMDPKAPVVESRLEHPPGKPAVVIGTFVNRMPFDQIDDCVAFYAGNAYPVGTILRNQEVRPLLDKGEPATAWLQKESQLATVLGRVSAEQQAPARYRGSNAPAAAVGAFPLWGVLFHESSLRNDAGVVAQNASLRRLDQSWRLNEHNRDEVILVGRVLPPIGSAEELLGGTPSPTKLWLKELPSSGKPRPPIPGTARQETYVRVYLPVRTAGAGQ